MKFKRIVASILLVVCFTALSVSAEMFNDLNGVSWAKEAINELYKDGIVNGKTETEFCPGDTVTRAEFVKMLVLTFNMNLIGSDLPFKDVKSNDWAYPYIRTAYIAGVVTGISEKRFGKDTNISREDICVMAVRMLDACDVEIVDANKAASFKDEQHISNYARSAVERLSRAGIVSGDEYSRFNPQSFATRAEAAKIIYSITKLLHN